MPDIEMLQLLSKVFDVGINDLLAGEKIADEDFRQKAEENIIEVATSSAFSFEDRKVYFKRKWRKEHIALFVILGLILIASAVIPLIIDKLWLISFSPVIALIEYGYQNNRMMIYVENQLYH